FSSRRRHTRSKRDWSSDVCSSDLNDIEKISSKDVPDHDVLLAGFPCQAFSLAGYRKGFADERGNVFFQVARILRDKRPNVVFLRSEERRVGKEGRGGWWRGRARSD